MGRRRRDPRRQIRVDPSPSSVNVRETGDFGKFLEEHRDELTAIEALDAVPYNLRVSSRDMKALAKAPARRTSGPGEAAANSNRNRAGCWWPASRSRAAGDTGNG